MALFSLVKKVGWIGKRGVSMKTVFRISYLKSCHRKEEMHRFCEIHNKGEAQEETPMSQILPQYKGEFFVTWALPEYRLDCH